MTPGKVSVVIPAHNEGENLIDTVHYTLRNTQYPDFEIVVVDDGSTDGSGEWTVQQFAHDERVHVVVTGGLGIPQARNTGAEAASGDILIFMDAHSYTPPGWMEALVTSFDDPGVGLVSPALANMGKDNGVRGCGLIWQDASLRARWLLPNSDAPYPVPLLPGGCMAARKHEFEAIGGFDKGMKRWGSQDLELSLRFWLMGFETVVNPQVVVYHLFRERANYHVETAVVLYNRLRLALLHFKDDRVERVIDYHKNIPGAAQSLIWLFESDVMDTRRWLHEQRKHDDDWYFDRFACEI